TVLGQDDSIELPPNSVDTVFICDTYHHFEFPQRILRTIHRALRPGGEIVLVDFRRAPGSPEWLLNHVRAGEETFVSEITAAGFQLVNDHDVSFLTDNYVLRFRKK
ncbi:MAG: class I SAM-dependent methyltransferase, partial [Candidatus Thorarchaeota archaeon]